jgi:hypothetical protein
MTHYQVLGHNAVRTSILDHVEHALQRLMFLHSHVIFRLLPGDISVT